MQLSDEAAAFLRESIISGALPSGSFIRPDRIAEALDSSVTPVREALVTLRGEGFVDLLPRKGFAVAKISGKDIRDLFNAQALLAGELAARAVQRCTPEQLVAIKSVQADLDRALQNGELAEVERLNHQFHRFITRTADSARMAWLLGIGARYVPRRFFAMIPGWPQASVNDHVAIIDALNKRDPERARAAMAAHFIHAGELLAANLDSRPTVSPDGDAPDELRDRPVRRPRRSQADPEDVPVDAIEWP